ncbi:MAG: hypothetical protein M0042_00340 [Nitrospiraceae bacterium]|nr:hypothetical protein [Nitrospiraceae bacterium]
MTSGAGVSSAQPQTAQTASPSGYKLIGTFESPEYSTAVIDDGSGQQNVYHLNQKLPDDSQIVRIKKNRITLKLTDGSHIDLVATGRAVSQSPAPAPPAYTPPPAPTPPAADQPAPAPRPAPQKRQKRIRSSEEE